MAKLVTTKAGVTQVIGRKLWLTPERADAIAKLVEDVFYLGTAAKGVGLHPQTAARYCRLGENHLLKVHPDGDPCTANCDEDMVAYRSFYDKIKKAQADFSAGNMQMIKSHRAKNFIAAAWLQERTQPDEFGLKTRTEHTGQGGGPIIHKVLPSVEQRQRVLESARQALMIETQQDEDGTFIPVEAE